MNGIAITQRSKSISKSFPPGHVPSPLSGGLQHFGDGRRYVIPLRLPFGKLLPAPPRQLVEARPPVIVRDPPLALDPAFLFNAVDGRVERPLFDLEHVFGEL